MLFVRQGHYIDAPLCRVHGRKAAWKYLGMTLLFGWWGMISFFVNVMFVVQDVRAIFGYSTLARPTRPPSMIGPQTTLARPPWARQPVSRAAQARTDAIAAGMRPATEVVSHAPPANGEWQQDPYRRYDYRLFHNGRWTPHVSTNGVVATDEPGWR